MNTIEKNHHELNKEIKQGYEINKKLELHNEDLIHTLDKIKKENELLKKSKAQKEK